VNDFRFPADEHAARFTQVRRRLVAAELDACIVMAPDSQLWLSGFDSFISGLLPQALIFTPDETAQPTLIVWDADIALARESSVLDDIRDYRFGVDDPVAAFTKVLAEKVPNAARVGIDGASRAVPHTFGAALSAAVAPATLVDCSTLLGDARVVKSTLELDCLRRAGQFAEVGLRAARERARPGVTERRLAAEIEYAMRCSGSDYPSIPTELSSGQRSLFVHGTPTHHVIAPGDIVHVEVGGVEARYNCVGLQTLCVGGAAPSATGIRLYDIALACIRAGLAAIRPDIEAHAVEAPALDILRAAGLGDAFKMRFGYGVGVGYPPSWLDPLQITRTSSQRLANGTTFVLHACLLDEPDQTGVVVGGTYALTEAGIEMLAGAGAVELLTV
jgi:Xaa-Pro dipeptidase